jgi:hypothetical protein
MFTTYVTPNLEQEAVVAGVDKVIAKSDGAAVLISSIQRLLMPDAPPRSDTAA